MAVNIDFSQIEDSPRTTTVPPQSNSGTISIDDAFIDVVHEGDGLSESPVASGSLLRISRLDQLSLLSVLVVLCTVFLSGYLFTGSDSEQPQTLAPYRVDVNTSRLEELMLLEGIGELTAEKILLDRESNGLFETENDLQRVKGIGPKTMERLRDHIVCR